MDRRSQSLSKFTVILRYREAPAWASIKTLRKNLLRAYKIAIPEALLVSTGRRSTKLPEQILELADRRVGLRLVFVDTSPPPKRLIDSLLHHFSPRQIELTFHVYGDFTLLSPEWNQILPRLKGLRVRFVTASSAHRQLLGSMLGPHVDRVICPFASDEEVFCFQGADSFRRKFKISPRSSVLIYTGRLSLEKNPELILLAAKRLDHLLPEEDLHLIICGKFDDVGEQFGSPSKQTSFKKKWQKTLSLLSPSLRARIIETGSLRPRQLAEALRASDCFVSLSTHHDEDFGLSPSESLMVGTPCVLSDWGGFRDFRRKNSERFCELVPVRLAASGPVVDVEAAVNAIRKTLASSPSDREKNRGARMAQSFYGIQAVAKRLRKIGQTSPPIITESGGVLGTHALRVMGLRHSFAAFHDHRPTDALYLKVYASYYKVKADLKGPKRASGVRRAKKKT